jgi:hypothetical protein
MDNRIRNDSASPTGRPVYATTRSTTSIIVSSNAKIFTNTPRDKVVVRSVRHNSSTLADSPSPRYEREIHDSLNLALPAYPASRQETHARCLTNLYETYGSGGRYGPHNIEDRSRATVNKHRSVKQQRCGMEIAPLVWALDCRVRIAERICSTRPSIIRTGSDMHRHARLMSTSVQNGVTNVSVRHSPSDEGAAPAI